LSQQQTINHPVELQGRGLFTGEMATVCFKPAPPNAGVTFIRCDQPDPIHIPARVENISKRARRSSIMNGTVTIETVEHCLAAIAGLGIDNLHIELNANELPASDGSCRPYVDALLGAGITPQPAERSICRITEQIRVEEGDTEIVGFPSNQEGLHLVYDLDYGSGPIGHQIFVFKVTPEAFIEQIAPARTFVLEEEARQFREAGLGAHLNFQDILVFGADGPIDNQLRFPEECVRHKILDLLGDLMLLGQFVQGRIYARKSGHSLNHEFVRKLREMMEAKRRATSLTSPAVYDIKHLQRILPHRYPFLMVDRVIKIEGSQRAVGVKNVTINEEFFQGHYPGQPIMPGVLIIEAMSQMGGILLSQELEHKGQIAVLLSLDRVKFRHAVMPGDQLILIAEAVRVKSRTGHVRCQAKVGDKLVAEADIKFMLVDADPV
jgi:UDP-3-O-[3-hydroxymyristoyl] N-acetylglucosamine deacetylase / 3-hydroxyacyl-[acyl-carrier-protein] dehydratase